MTGRDWAAPGESRGALGRKEELVQPVGNGNLPSAAGDPHPRAAQDVEVDGFALHSCWAITGGKNGSKERNELGEQHWSPVSSAFFFSEMMLS